MCVYIYIELIECCHLVGAILIEIPKMVANAFDTKRKLTSRALKVSTNPSTNPFTNPSTNPSYTRSFRP